MVLNAAAYHFVSIADPEALAARLEARAAAADLLGSVLVAGEGVNLFLAGAELELKDFFAALQAEPGLETIRVKYSASRARPFQRLKVRVKPEIIAFRRPSASPLQRRAPAVAPATLARWLAQGSDDRGRALTLLDTRNREEVGHGSFAGALALPIDNFTDLPAALEPHFEALAATTVVSFCTGGVRCEKAALWMGDSGMEHVVQLDGGILGYFEQVGGLGYEGNCFVFDQRVALDPRLRPVVEPAEG